MNRDERRKVKRIVQDYDRSLRSAYEDFEREMSIMKDNESEKISSLPSSFEEAPIADKLRDSVDMFSTILEKSENIMEALNDILDAADVKSVYSTGTRKTKIVSEKKDVSFHALLSSSLFKRLKEESLRTGLSMNEIISRTLSKELQM